MKAVKCILPLLGAVVLLLYSTIIFSSPAALGTGHNQGGFGNFGQDSCGNVEVTAVSDNCPTGHDAINSYTMSVTVRNTRSNTPVTINGEMRTYWCTPDQLRPPDPGTGQGANSCYSNGSTSFPSSSSLSKGQSFTFTAPTRTANVCGAIFQDDFNYTYNLAGKTCHNSISSIRYHAAYGYCASSSVCVSPTPTHGITPTPTQGVTPTPTYGATPTPTPTYAVTPTPSPTPTYGITPTPTYGATPTPPIVQETPPPTQTVNNNVNEQQQSQSQNQYNNNNQSVNVSVASPQQPQQVSGTTQAVLGTTTVVPASTTPVVTQLPSTGSPVEVLEVLVGLAPLGVFLRKIA